MIIPIRCFTCNKVIGDKWDPFIQIITEKKNISTDQVDNELDIEYIILQTMVQFRNQKKVKHLIN